MLRRHNDHAVPGSEPVGHEYFHLDRLPEERRRGLCHE